jgi:hypothetical protein
MPAETLVSGEDNRTYDAGIFELGSIEGNVSEDVNNDDNGDVNLSGIRVDLVQDSNNNGFADLGEPIVSTKLTDNLGNYSFENLEPGNYVVVEKDSTLSPKYTDVKDGDATDDDAKDTADNNTPNNDQIPVTLSNGEADINNNFVEEQLGTISGLITADTTDDNKGDVVLPNVIVNLISDTNGNGKADPGEPIISRDTTDRNGEYTFVSVPSGIYVVSQEDPIGYFDVSDIDESIVPTDLDGVDGLNPNDMIPVVLTPGEDDKDNNFVESLLDPKVDIKKYTNGEDADVAPGALVFFFLGKQKEVNWRYDVKNSGNLDLVNVVVRDDKQGLVCTIDTLKIGETKVCNLTGVAQLGQYTNLGTVVGQPIDPNNNLPIGSTVSDNDPSNYFGTGFNIDKAVDKSVVCPGDSVTFSVKIRMYGGLPGLSFGDISFKDNMLPGKITTSSPFFVGRDANNNQRIDYQEAGKDIDGDGTIDGEFCWNYKMKINQSVSNIVMDTFNVYYENEIVDSVRSSDTADVAVIVTTACLAEIGDTTWIDSNVNGLQDAGEPIVSGVPVTLLKGDGTPATVDGLGAPIVSKVTDANGFYEFVNLIPGDYKVQFGTPSGYQRTIADAGNDAKDSDANQITGLTPTYNLVAGERDSTVDAGFYQLAGLGDYVWYDANRNGIQDNRIDPFTGTVLGAELPVEGARMILFNGVTNLPVDSTLTNSTGLYRFDNLVPGQYYVKFNPATYPDTGFVLTNKDQGGDDTKDSDFDRGSYRTVTTMLISGENDPTWDMGIFRATDPTITDPCSCNDARLYSPEFTTYFYSEQIKVEGTPGESWAIINGPDASTGISTQGVIIPNPELVDDFIDLVPGTTGQYRMTEVTPGNFTFDFFHLSENGYGIVVTNGIDTLSIKNLCYQSPIDIDSTPMFLCKYDKTLVLPATTPTGNVKYYLIPNEIGPVTNPDLSMLQQITSINPALYNTNDLVQYYTVFEPTNPKIAPNGLPFGTCSQTLVNVITIGVDKNCLAAIGDTTWIDANVNGLKDASEAIVSGVPVTLLKGDGTPATVDGLGAPIVSKVTDANGFYEFVNLIPGDYKVQFGTPSGYQRTIADAGNDTKDSDANQTTGITPTYNLSVGERDSTVDAGYYQSASLGDYVWYDANQNGIQDDRLAPVTGQNLGAELPVEGVRMVLFNGVTNQPLDSTLTDATGLYRFDNLVPGDYYVKFDPSTYPDTGYVITMKDQGTNDAKDSDIDVASLRTVTTTLVSGENDPSWDMGIFRDSDPTIEDPCTCNDSRLYLPDFSSYFYSEEVSVKGTAGETWTIIDGPDRKTGITTNGIIIPNPDLADDFIDLVPGTAGQYKLTEVSPGEFKFNFFHIAENGYGIVVTNGKDTLSIKNLCYQAPLDVDSFPQSLCKYDPKLVLPATTATGNVKYYLVPPTGPVVNPDFSQLQQITSIDPSVYNVNDFVSYYTVFEPTNPGLAPNGLPFTTCPQTIISTLSITLNNCLAEIGDTTWLDNNFNGLFDAGELGLNKIKVTLLDSLGTPVTVDGLGNPIVPVTTNLAGFYEFTNLIPGKYRVQFGDLPGFARTKSNESNDARDSDANEGTGITPVYELSAGERDSTVDAGFIRLASIGDYVWMDMNTEAVPSNNVQDAGDVGINGIKVSLYDADTETKLKDTLTGANPITELPGYYVFEGLMPGNYYVTVEKPSELSFVVGNAGTNDAIDSDIMMMTGNNGRTSTVPLNPGDNYRDLDIGLNLEVILPVTMKTFYGEHNTANNSNDLTWVTSSESNNDRFEVQRSVNGSKFETIGQVKGSGTSSIERTYNFNDEKLLNTSATYVYQLKQVDFDGTFAYSKKVEIAVEKEVNEVSINVYPNPVVDFFSVDVIGAKGEAFKAGVYDNTGKLVSKISSSTITSDIENVRFDTNNLVPGVYLLRVNVGQKEFSKKILIVE